MAVPADQLRPGSVSIWAVLPNSVRLPPRNLLECTLERLVTLTVFLPIERVHTRDQFVLEARESYWIKQYKSVKNKQIEHGLNLVP